MSHISRWLSGLSCLIVMSYALSAQGAIISGVITPGTASTFDFSGADKGGTATGTMTIAVSSDGRTIKVTIDNTSGNASSITGFGFNTNPDFFVGDSFDFYLLGKKKASDNTITTVLLGSDLGANVAIDGVNYSNLNAWQMEYDSSNKNFGIKTDALASTIHGVNNALHDPTTSYASNHNSLTEAVFVMTLKNDAVFNANEGVIYNFDTLKTVYGGSDRTLGPVLRFQEVGNGGSLKLTPTDIYTPPEPRIAAVPEPTSVLIWCVGVAALGLRKRLITKQEGCPSSASC